MSRAREEMAVAELARCRDDYWHWATVHARIPHKVDEEGRVEVKEFRPRAEQIMVRREIVRHRQVYILKARQLGITTECGLNRLWWTMHTPYFRHGVLAHTQQAAEAIFQVNYVDVYERLPAMFKKVYPLKRCNDGQMLFANGAEIVVSWAESPSFAGRPFGSYHFSEYAKYRNEEKLMRDIMAGAGPNAQIVYETNADGYNHAHAAWYADNGLKKVFLPWTDAAEYVSDRRPDKRVKEIEDYAAEYNLRPEQKFFVYEQVQKRFRGVLRSFHQNFPATPELAFVSSGDKFFRRTYPHARATTGLLRKEGVLPAQHRAYVMGIDTASGAQNGDFSAWVVLDVTDAARPVIVSTFYMKLKPDEFKQKAYEEAQYWGALVVPETNSYGLGVLEHFIQNGYGRIYRDNYHDDAVGRFVSKLGFFTTKPTRELLLNQLASTVDQEWFDIWDGRLQAEINGFAFNDDAKPKAEAGPGQHDDMLVALALALIGRPQAATPEQRSIAKRPVTTKEKLAFFIRNGRNVNENDVFEDDDMTLRRSPLQGVAMQQNDFM